MWGHYLPCPLVLIIVESEFNMWDYYLSCPLVLIIV